MAIYYRTRGFVFKKNDRNESDRIFSVFTEDFGRLEITAKAVRKITSKLRAGIDMFSFSEIEFIHGKNSKTFIGAEKTENLKNLYRDFRKIEIAYRISGILDDFIKGEEKDRALFSLLNETFNKLNNFQFPCPAGRQAGKFQLLFHYFFWNFMSLQGFHLEVGVCAVCLKKLNPYNIYFSAKEGGAICKNCVTLKKTCPESCRRINSDVVKILRLILNKDWETICRLKVGQSSQALLENVFESALHAFSPVHS